MGKKVASAYDSGANVRSLCLVAMSAFIGMLFGMYGVKVDAPTAAWVPDVHGEAPDALLNGAGLGAFSVIETRASSTLILEPAIPIISTPQVLALLPEHDVVLARPHRTCAVVGNSAILLGQQLGAQIDGHDFVLRMNWAPAGGSAYEVDVGARTDGMIVGASTSLQSRYKPYGSYANFSRSVSVFYEMHEFEQWQAFVENHNVEGAPPAQFALSHTFQKMVDMVACKSGAQNAAEMLMRHSCRASTGLRAVLLALMTCDTVDLYGFGTAKGYGHAPYFFGHRRVYRESAQFDYHAEKRIMQSLAKNEPPGVLRRIPLGALMIHDHGTVHKDSFSKEWTKYPRLAVYNEERDVSSSSYDKREPPLRESEWKQRELPMRQYATVNNLKPSSYWDYRAHEIVYSNHTYEKGPKLGHGTYGDVYKAAQPWADGREIVLKYLKSQDHRPWILSREVMILNQLGGKNHTIELLDTVMAKDHTVLVFPLIHIESSHVIYDFEDIHVRYYTYKLFEALGYAHSLGILHNDVKPLNLLLDAQTRRQYLADWGLGEYYFPPNNTGGPNTTLSFHVGTRHWKAPELLMGAHHYGYEVDIWSAGITFLGFLFRRTHFFPGVDNQHQIVLIVQHLGTKALDDYIERYEVPVDRGWYAKHIGTWGKKSWASHFTADTMKFYKDGVDELLDQIMVFDPAERATADEVLAHRYFDPVRHMSDPPEWPWQADEN